MIDINSFASRHIGPRNEDITDMLKVVKCKSLDDLINKSLNIKFKSFIKRGCSEFSIKYPEYKIIDTNSKYFLKYNHEWQEKEKIINEFYPKNISNELNPSNTLKGNSLNDMIIIKNWIDYAKSKNDLSYKILT